MKYQCIYRWSRTNDQTLLSSDYANISSWCPYFSFYSVDETFGKEVCGISDTFHRVRITKNVEKHCCSSSWMPKLIIFYCTPLVFLVHRCSYLEDQVQRRRIQSSLSILLWESKVFVYLFHVLVDFVHESLDADILWSCFICVTWIVVFVVMLAAIMLRGCGHKQEICWEYTGHSWSED
jgi:hypothetical protein